MLPSRNLIKSALFIIVLGGIFALGYQGVEYNWQWYRIWPYFLSVQGGQIVPGILFKGLVITLKISGLGLVLSLLLGSLSAVARLSPFPVLRIMAWIYVETIRNTPLLIQIFLIYFVISPVLDISAFWSAVWALSLFEGAYASEIIRSGIIGTPKGQIEAALGLGLSKPVIYYKVIIPQMLRTTLPMLAGQSVSLIKDSALVSTISIYDLTMQAQKIVSETFLTFEIWFAVAICYLVITASLSFFIRQLELRMKFGN
ncbi:MAG TPA: polar amino acid ABC transporter permease [Desulfobacteraceae bacterium]|nr:polar amino acid ABC transporter permease [Desulfobacteraceae bacterium]|tara:strand:+ start:491 stop:1261 length:771 start_codon:yes stop_codon:yes gene_type:complete